MWPRRRRPNLKELVERLECCHRCGASVGTYERACQSCGSPLVAEKKALLRELRDGGSMTPDVFEAAVAILEDDAKGHVAERGRAIRKQLSEIRIADLQEFPIWEFALDEEGLEGQDEQTVRPRPDLARVDPRDGLFVVRAEFVAADGTTFDGFMSPHQEPHVVRTQPTILAGERQLRFWFGIVAPEPAVLHASYRALGKTATDLFPLRYRSLVETVGRHVAGTVDGFMHYVGGSTREIASIR